MDERAKNIFSVFVRNERYDKAFEVLEAVYAEDKEGAYDLIKRYRRGLTALAKGGNAEAMKWLRAAYFLTARDYFDDYCIAVEWERPYKSKFYLRRRRQLLPIVNELQRLADDKLDVLCISCPPGIGKTALAQFYLMWLAGRNPYEGMLTASHNASFVKGVYEEFLRELDPDGEYRWHEIFPGRNVTRANAADLKIDIDKVQKYSTLQHTSIGAGNAGRFRAVQLLYCDDLIEGIEEALNNDRLDVKWTKFSTDLLQRRQGNCKILMIATRWSVRDPIGRLMEQYEGDARASFLSMPALNERDESNFDYGGSIGFSTKYFKKLREMMDEASFRALYMNEPVERSGILYHSEELRRYFDLPTEKPDAVWAVCDTKNSGDDYFVMPIALQYGEEYYIDKIIFDNKTPEVVEPRLIDALMAYEVNMARFESNSAGGRIAQNVQEKVKEKGGNTKITTKYSTANKQTRIIVDSAFVKEHFLFKDQAGYDPEYRAAMNTLVSYTMNGNHKKKHDDVPDAMSMLADFVQSKFTSKALVMRRPF